MRIKNKYSSEVAKNLKKILSYIEKRNDKEIENQTEVLLSILRLITDDDFYEQINKTKTSSKNIIFNLKDGSYAATSLSSIKYASKEKYNELSKKVENNITDGIYKICERNNLDRSIYEKIVESYIQKNKLIIPSKIVDLKSSEYRSKVRLIVGKPKPVRSSEPIYLQIFSNTTQSSVRKFFRENDLEISRLTKKTTPYPFGKKFRNIKKELLCYISNLLGKTNGEIIKYISNIYNDEINLDETNIHKNIRECKKMVDLGTKK